MKRKENLDIFTVINFKVPHLTFSTADGSKCANVVAQRLGSEWRRYMGVFAVSPVFHRLDAEEDK